MRGGLRTLRSLGLLSLYLCLHGQHDGTDRQDDYPALKGRVYFPHESPPRGYEHLNARHGPVLAPEELMYG